MTGGLLCLIYRLHIGFALWLDIVLDADRQFGTWD